ncbi:MAG TPA: hypothetical protein VMV57_03360 [Terracidiphilus sp.]|nr:hypothetical protein [Terracidiphilus sp.]
MSGDKGAIWRLLAIGRISPGEAERLLAACQEGRETKWILACCVALAVLAKLHGNWLLPESVNALAGGMNALTHWMGGLR